MTKRLQEQLVKFSRVLNELESDLNVILVDGVYQATTVELLEAYRYASKFCAMEDNQQILEECFISFFDFKHHYFKDRESVKTLLSQIAYGKERAAIILSNFSEKKNKRVIL